MDDSCPTPAWRVAVLCGGNSCERSVSLESGSNVAAALAVAGHVVDIIDPAETDLLTVNWSPYDVAFLALHGAFGEDGAIQDLLDGFGVPFTGSDALTSRLAFNKAAAKERFVQGEVPTPEFALVTRRDSLNAVKRAADRLGYPLVVKPNSQGSSFGISLVHSAEQLEPAIHRAFEYDSAVLLEVAILGDEWTVPLLDSHVLPPVRVTTRRELFDFHAKYLDEDTGYSFAATSSQATLRSIEDAARRACSVLGTRGIARVDLRLDDQQRPYVLEVNTIPGMTSHSLVPKSAERLGWSLTDVCERAIVSALQKVTGVQNRHETHRTQRSSRFVRAS